MAFTLTSTAFKQEELIPQKYTCDGQDLQPQIAWQDAPVGTQSFALIMDDPDAPMGTWDHWLVFNIAPTVHEIKENGELPANAKEGLNSWGRTGYGGPCPPDKLHRYYFKLYALDKMLDLSERVKKAEIEKAMAGHILAKAELMGRYDRAQR